MREALAQLVRQRIPDREGNTLPVDVSSVTYDLQDLTQRSHSLTVGELAVGGTWGVQAVQPPCPECCGQDVLGFSPDPVDLATGNTDTVAIDGIEACNGDPTVLTPDFTSWSSGNSSIASVSYAKVKGLAVGSTTGYANGLVQVPGACACNFVPAQTNVPITVQVPTSLSVVNVTVLPNGSGPPNGCPASNNYGIMVDIKYEVLDQNTQPILSANMTPHEKGTLFDGTPFDNNIGPVQGYPTSSATTASDGTFHDVPFGYCQNLPISNPGLTATQNITIIMPDGTTPAVRSQTFTVTAPGSKSFGHGTITNGSDISATR